MPRSLTSLDKQQLIDEVKRGAAAEHEAALLPLQAAVDKHRTESATLTAQLTELGRKCAVPC